MSCKRAHHASLHITQLHYFHHSVEQPVHYILPDACPRYMVITIKHSGSLVTLSAHGFAAKNSVDNAYTAGGEALLLAHYQRMYGEQAQQKLQALVDAMRQRKLAVSFEMVTGRLLAGRAVMLSGSSDIEPWCCPCSARDDLSTTGVCLRCVKKLADHRYALASLLVQAAMATTDRCLVAST